MSSPPSFSSLVDSLGAIVWDADPETFQFLVVSAQAEAILGYPVRQWIDEPDFWRCHTPPDACSGAPNSAWVRRGTGGIISSSTA